jgi:hypothetical protein
MGTTECRHIGMVVRFVFGLKVRAAVSLLKCSFVCGALRDARPIFPRHPD